MWEREFQSKWDTEYHNINIDDFTQKQLSLLSEFLLNSLFVFSPLFCTITNLNILRKLLTSKFCLSTENIDKVDKIVLDEQFISVNKVMCQNEDDWNQGRKPGITRGCDATPILVQGLRNREFSDFATPITIKISDIYPKFRVI